MSETIDGFVGRITNLEQCVEFGELEQHAKVFVQTGEAQDAAGLTYLLRDRDEHAESG